MTGLSCVKTSPKWSMQGRWGDSKGPEGRAANAPGPGAYSAEGYHETSRFSKAARFVFGSSTRDGFGAGGKMPGPGAYTPKTDPVDQVSPRWGFGTSLRQGLGKGTDDAPGPGTYAFRSTVGTAG